MADTPSISAAAVKPSIDWAAVRARVERATQHATEDAAADRALLQRRAAALARPLPQFGESATDVDAVATLAITLSGQNYGVDARFVRETVPLPSTTRLPGLPPTLRGLANVRSQIVPAFDIRPLLQLRPAADDAHETMLIAVFEGAVFGIVIDAVVGMQTVPRADVRTEVAGLQTKYLTGIGPGGLLLLDLPLLAEALAIEDRPV